MTYNPIGSTWRRWDPHIHAPGTVLNDQFGNESAWEEYLYRLENSSPTVEALGITDYFSLRSYKALLEWKAKGRLEAIDFIFPNIEMRYAVGTSKAAPINFHLLISPDDPEHVDQTERFLENLTFRSGRDTYRCREVDIIRLGKSHSGAELDDSASFREGVNQFKIEVDQFLDAWDASPWIQENALIAVAASSNDGTSGIKEASLSALRQKIERHAQVIFASQAKQREFWLGKGVVSLEELIEKYGGPKPVLHGSDAHSLEKVCAPDKDRYTWLKGDACFETLRQACLEPELRSVVSNVQPTGAFPSQTIASISIEGADWFDENPLPLNPGLVGVIGARGSGKTALADMIAAGACALSQHSSEKSFVKRASEHLEGTKSLLHWADKTESYNELQHVDIEDFLDTPRVQYLSQQFVEQLCSSTGATDELIAEIERVVYLAHPAEERLGAEDFQQLLSTTAARGRGERERHENAVSKSAEKIAKLRDTQDLLKPSQAKQKELVTAVEKERNDRKKLIVKGAEEHAQALEEISKVADVLRARLEAAKRRKHALNLLADQVKDYRERVAVDEWSALKHSYRETHLLEDDWPTFQTDFVGDVDAVIKSAQENAKKIIAHYQKGRVDLAGKDDVVPSTKESHLPKNVALDDVPLATLELEESRLRALIGVNEEKRKAYARLTKSIRAKETQQQNLSLAINEAEGAQSKIEELLKSRSESYTGVFDGIVAEEQALSSLYQPVSDLLEKAEGSLNKLSFSIRRQVDVQVWADRGEELIDTRKSGEFFRRGSLLKAAKDKLEKAWTSGTSKDVAEAMKTFRKAHNDDIRSGAKADPKDKERWRAWGAEVSDWLYGTEHIKVTYGIRYDGVEIEKLSPGTRGIVLLLLYLAIDTQDDRPLIIDQPEENLDPQSIFDELVFLFRQAKLRRQIIIVTHNANLVVNTDVDQVIVAQCGPQRAGKLPELKYETGSLENPFIRKRVCDILEGGERAFRERARRLRVSLK